VFSPQLVTELSRLVAMEVDAVRACENALALVPPGPIRDELEVIGREHRAHADALREEIAFRGYLAPDITSTLEGVVLGALPSTRQPHGAEEVLSAVQANEHLVSALYGRLLAKGPPERARELVERLRTEAERHRGWAERTLARRPWESGGASP
jgi:hypothetical protein